MVVNKENQQMQQELKQQLNKIQGQGADGRERDWDEGASTEVEEQLLRERVQESGYRKSERSQGWGGKNENNLVTVKGQKENQAAKVQELNADKKQLLQKKLAAEKENQRIQ